jgi:GT2 family glycosyltransferase
MQLIIVDNRSTEATTAAWLRSFEDTSRGRMVIDADIPFNWSILNNLGAEAATGDYLLFLNNDTEALDENSISGLLYATSRNPGNVAGPLLLYPDGSIQHAGLVLGFGGCADHLYRGASPSCTETPFVRPTICRDVSAVTGAAMMLARETFNVLGGFDEAFDVVGSDVDMCIRAAEAGGHVVYEPASRFVHHESQTRNTKPPRHDLQRLRRLLAERGALPDAHYHPNLSLQSRYPLISPTTREHGSPRAMSD